MVGYRQSAICPIASRAAASAVVWFGRVRSSWFWARLSSSSASRTSERVVLGLFLCVFELGCCFVELVLCLFDGGLGFDDALVCVGLVLDLLGAETWNVDLRIAQGCCFGHSLILEHI